MRRYKEPTTRAHIRAFYRPFYKRPIFWLALLVMIVGIGLMALDPLARHYTARALHQMHGYDGEFRDVHVTVFPPRYHISRLKMIEVPGGHWKQPFFYAEDITAGLDWRSLLFHRQLDARVRVVRPKLVVERPPGPKPPARPLPDVGEALEQAPALRVERIEVKNGEVLFRDLADKGQPELWLHDMEVVVENVATREPLEGGRPVTVTGRAVLQRTGVVTTFLSADPWASRGLTFAGQTSLRGLAVDDLYGLVTPQAELKPTKGTVDMFAEYRATDGALTGGVKPVLKDVEVSAAHADLGNRLKAWLVDTGLDLFSDRVPDRHAVATTIPIKGRIEDPHAQLWPTVLGVVRNAFVEGLASGISNLPPDTAEKKEGPIQQAKEAIIGSEPPKAQPEKPKAEAEKPKAQEDRPKPQTEAEASKGPRP